MKKSVLLACRGIIFLIISFFYSLNSSAQSGVVDVGKSFANITKLASGGTFEPNDIIEVRVTFAVGSIAPGQITAVQVFDTVPAKATYVPGSIRIATNENHTYKGPYTDANDADAGRNVGGNILINLGTGATGIAGGTIKNTDLPSFYGATCILVACYRLQINAADNYGDTIKIGGKVVYKVSGVTKTINFPLYYIYITQSIAAACSNGLGPSAASDSLGTFASGTSQNRAASLAYTTTYIKQNLGTNSPQDYNYAIANNSSADGSTNPNSTMPEAVALHRVFGLWDISGDHTGAANTALGNPPVAPGVRGGYMVLINASYKTDTAYRETLSNLCPNSYYEFTVWLRNLCARCGCDSSGKGSGTAGYVPSPGNDSSGVRPNISFAIDGLASYTSGDIPYDRNVPWKKYGFVFLTKPSQTSANFIIRNNSPGGGGNDWAMDDLNVSHCGPTLKMNHPTRITLCKESTPFPINLSDTVKYIYNASYVYFQWQKSNVGGTTWSNMVGPGTSGIGTPVLINGMYQYVTILPTFMVTYADSGTYYRLIVATTLGNLTGACAFNDGTSTMINVITCGIILATDITKFDGQLISKKAYLTWSATNEQNLKDYEIEKSTDDLIFSKVESVSAKNTITANYSFTDPIDIAGNTYYRIKMVDRNGFFKYSSTILLSNNKLGFEINNLKNPINNIINVDVVVPKEGLLNMAIYNGAGQLVKNIQLSVNKGLNNMVINKIDIPNGIYLLSVEFNHEFIKRKLVKIN